MNSEQLCLQELFEKLYELELPSILKSEHITKKDCTFNLASVGEYHDLYFKTDLLLLADVFEQFRETCLEYYKLDPCLYFFTPGLSWDAMFKTTDVKLEYMADVDMYHFCEKGKRAMRGGIDYIADRYAKS